MDHYLVRLARACGCSSRQLASIVWDSSNALTYDHRFVENLERLTGQAGLIAGTFNHVNGVICGLRRGPTNMRRWCPACYDEWTSSSFEPLFWNVPTLRCCPHHLVPLQARCMLCGARQSSEQSYSTRRKCATCGEPLHSSIPRVANRELDWSDRMLLDLCYYASNRSSDDVDVERLYERLRSFDQIDRISSGLNVIGVAKSRLSTSSLLKACARTRATPTELFSESALPFEMWFPFEYECSFDGPEFNRVKRQRLHSCATAIEALSRARSYVLPVKVVSRLFGAQSHVAKRFPGKCGGYMEMHRRGIGNDLLQAVAKAADRAIELWRIRGSELVSLSGVKHVARKLRFARAVNATLARQIAVAALRVVRMAEQEAAKGPSRRSVKAPSSMNYRARTIRDCAATGVGGAPLQLKLF